MGLWSMAAMMELSPIGSVSRRLSPTYCATRSDWEIARGNWAYCSKLPSYIYKIAFVWICAARKRGKWGERAHNFTLNTIGSRTSQFSPWPITDKFAMCSNEWHKNSFFLRICLPLDDTNFIGSIVCCCRINFERTCWYTTEKESNIENLWLNAYFIRIKRHKSVSCSVFWI